MNLFAPLFFAHDALWSIFTPGGAALTTGRAFVGADVAAVSPEAETLLKADTGSASHAVSKGGIQRNDDLTSPFLPPTHLPTQPPLPDLDVPRWRSEQFEHRDGLHRFKIYVPSGFRGKPMPLIVMLHGAQQDPDDFAAGTQMNVIAEQEGFLVMYPEQGESENLMRCWNWFKPSNQARDSGETARIAALTREVIATYNVDPARVYVAGMSAGGAMAINLAVTHPNLYAAAAIHSGVAFGVADDEISALCAMNDGKGSIRLPKATSDAPGPRAVPLIVFHGDTDTVVHPRNSEQVIEMSQFLRGDPDDAITSMATHVECENGRHGFTRHVDRDKNGKLLGERWLIHSLGHSWSGGHPDGTHTDLRGPDASAEMVRFFIQFALDRSSTIAC